MQPEDIRALREHLQMNQQEFATLLGLKTRGAICHFEAGAKKPKGPALVVLQLLAEKHLPKKQKKSK